MPPTDLITSYFIVSYDSRYTGSNTTNIDIDTKWFSEHGVAGTLIQSNMLIANSTGDVDLDIIEALVTSHKNRNLYYALGGLGPDLASAQALYNAYVARGMFPGINDSYHFYLLEEMGLEWLNNAGWGGPTYYSDTLTRFSNIINWLKTQVGAHTMIIFMSPVITNIIYGQTSDPTTISTYYKAWLNDLGNAVGVGADLKLVSMVQDMVGRWDDLTPGGSRYSDVLANVAAHYTACSTTNYGTNIIGKTNTELFRATFATLTAGSFVVGTMYQIVSIGTTDFTLIGAGSNTVGRPFIATGVGSGTGTARYITGLIMGNFYNSIKTQIIDEHPYSDNQLGASWAWYPYTGYTDFINNYHLYYAGPTDLITSYFLIDYGFSGPTDPDIVISTKWFSEHGVAGSSTMANQLDQVSNTQSSLDIIGALATCHRNLNLYYSVGLATDKRQLYPHTWWSCSDADWPTIKAEMEADAYESYNLYISNGIIPGINGSYYLYIETEWGIDNFDNHLFAQYNRLMELWSDIINHIYSLMPNPGTNKMIIFWSPWIYSVTGNPSVVTTYYTNWLNALGTAVSLASRAPNLKLVCMVQDGVGSWPDQHREPGGANHANMLTFLSAHYTATSGTSFGSNIIGKVNLETFMTDGGTGWQFAPWSRIYTQIIEEYPYSTDQIGASWAWYQYWTGGYQALIDFRNSYHLYYSGPTNIISVLGG